MIRSLPLFLVVSAAGFAQESEEPPEPEVLEGHSLHGSAFDEGPRQAAYLMPNNGSVHFPITSAHAEAQAMFDQGLGQLHGFWYFESERSFRQVAAFDEGCAAAYWGMAMANVENEERASGFAREAWLRREGASERERLYVDMLARFYDVDYPEPKEGEKEHERKPGDDKKRRRQLVKDYEQVLFEYPDDIEAKALLVNLIWLNSRKGLPISSKQANQALLDQVFAAQPAHPAQHYRIHLWDDDSAKWVIETALNAGPSWPTVAHQWHMGGHIFARLGRHAEAAWQQEASARVDHAHMMRDRVLPDQIHNFAHNNEWLTRSLANCGRVHEALDLAQNMVRLPRHPKWNRLDKRGSSSAYGRQRLFGHLETFELWDELVALADTNYLERSEKAGDEIYRAYLLGKAHAFRGDEDAFAEQLERLRELLDEEKDARTESVERAEQEALDADKKTADVREAMAKALEQHEGTLKDLRRKIDSLEALDDVLAGREVEEGLKALDKGGFDKALLARLHADADLGEKAEELARSTADKRKGVAHAKANLADVLERVGKRDEALEVFRELRESSAQFDLDVPVFARLLPLAEAEGLPADWRVAQTVPEDVGERVDPETLGPKRWSPTPAPAWSCPDAAGQQHTLADTRGTPRVLILFLGFECAHCIEQLATFGPTAEEYRAAGIEIIAIGTDTAEAIAEYGDAGDYGFPILADPEHEVFHAYRAYDDFEDMPLHGTFLIDGEDRVRWQDVSYEPFTDTDFLLAEARRLLGLPATGEALEAHAPAEQR